MIVCVVTNKNNVASKLSKKPLSAANVLAGMMKVTLLIEFHSRRLHKVPSKGLVAV